MLDMSPTETTHVLRICHDNRPSSPTQACGKMPQLPRKQFAYDSIAPKHATERPLSSDAAQNHTPNHYTYS